MFQIHRFGEVILIVPSLLPLQVTFVEATLALKTAGALNDMSKIEDHHT